LPLSVKICYMKCKPYLNLIIASLLLFSALPAFAQSTVTGKVTDQRTGLPLAGVNVAIKNSKTTVATDNEGMFSIQANAGADLVFTYVGYVSAEMKAGSSPLSVSMTPDAANLEEVVMIGYGTVKRKDLTGSVFSAKREDILRTPTHNAVEALQGRVPGVDLSRNSGTAGSGVNIRVRGNRSLNASNEPLFIIDGFQGGSPSDLNPNDIESIEVLKDAAATAIYGSQGANGVFIVTTRKGRSGQTKISYDGFYGINGYTSYPKLRLGDEYIQLRREAYRNTSPQEWNSPADDAKLFPNASEAAAVAAGDWIDWFDLLNRNGIQQSHSVSVQSGTDKTKFYLSLGYFNEQGMLRRNDYSRYSVRFNLDHNLAKWAKTGVQTQIAYFDQNNRTDPLSLVMQTSPLGKAYDENGKINVFPVAGNGTILSPITDERGDTIATNNVIRTNILTNAYVELTPIRGLTFRSNFGVNLNFLRQGIYNSSTSVSERTTRLTTSSQGAAFTRAINWDNVLTYSKSFGEHDLTVAAVQSYIQNNVDTLSGRGNRQLLGSQLFYNLGATDPTSQRVGSGYTLYNNLAFAGRINYTYKDKYLLTLTARADGASRLSPGNKWDYFPSIAVAWNIKNEKFMDNIAPITNLKLRASYGETGNYGIAVYGTQSGVSSANNLGFGDVPVSYYQFNARVGNPSLEWERTATTNLALDFGLLNNRITGSVDVYNAKTSNIIFERTLPRSTGVTSIYQNIGETVNKGIEVVISARVVQNKAFKWDVTASFTKNKEEITKLINGTDIISGTTPETLSLLLGHPLTSWYSYEKLGIWQTDKASEAALVKFGSTPFKPGDIHVEDLNGDGLIDTKDRQFLGSPVPKFVLGLQNNFSYKGIDLGIYFFMRYGQMINAEFMGRYNPSGEGNGPANFDYWTPENPTNDFPRPIKGGQIINYAAYQSLNFIDGSYFKIKTVTLGYTIPPKIASKIHAGKIRVYATGNNIFTKAKHHLLDDYDPERNGSESSPLSRQLVFGVNLEF